VAVELIDPDGLYHPPTYSHVAVGRGSSIVFVSGQVGYDENGQLVGDDHASQGERAFQNVRTAVEAAGASVEDVVKITIYVVDHGPGVLETLMAARASVFGEHKPASTYLGVAALARPGLLVEVDAVAVLD